MSEFQRFVTYINLYEENNKIRNIGFAKIENRNGKCKIEIHIRGTGYTGISCPVYLFVRKENGMEGISVGKLQLKNGVGDGRYLVDGENICQSGHPLEQVKGFLIFINEKLMFASQWDDQEIVREQFFLPAAPPEQKQAEQLDHSEEQKSLNQSSENPETQQQTFIPKSGENNQNHHASEQGLPNGSLNQRQQSERAEPPQPNNHGEQGQHNTHLNGGQQSNHLSGDQQNNQHSGGQQNSRSEQGLQNHPLENTKTVPFQPAKNPALKATEAAAQKMLKPVMTDQPSQKVLKSISSEQEQPWEQKWQFILENYPVLTPFEGEEEILCIRMELKDLRLLPKRFWYLGNNSFLLHGFFNYRYLIFGCMKKAEKTEWFIGIPGVFQSQEKVMAAIFGFPEYKSEKKCTQKTGQFGYWYRFMDL